MNPALASAHAILALLERWVGHGWLRDLDAAFARFCLDHAADADPLLLLSAALASHQLGRGHACLDLTTTLADPALALALPPDAGLPEEGHGVALPADLLAGLSADTWAARLVHTELVGDGAGATPMVLSGSRLYLRRYWRYERAVEAAIGARLGNPDPEDEEQPGIDRALLDALFPPSPDNTTDWQKLACAVAASGRFSVVTGGPGTGKTTTVVRLLALLQAQALALDPERPLRIRLAAPTGKAAARLRASIAGAVDGLTEFTQQRPGLRDAIPIEVTTLHRLLGPLPETRRFRHSARHPLPLDVLVIDEGSMIDLELFATVLDALPPAARLVVLGDKDQLASVEAGSVLGELCRRAQDGHYRPDTLQRLAAATGETVDPALVDETGRDLDQRIVMLRRSHRFDAASGIGQLAAAVNAGDAAAIDTVWALGHADLTRLDLSGVDDARFDALLLGDAAAPGFAGYLDEVRQRPALDADRATFDAWAAKVLAAHGRFQLLCALRQGPFGVMGLNARAEALLAARGLIAPDGAWYAGRPVLVTRNDYSLGRMNGDIGVALPWPVRDPAADTLRWGLRVAFPDPDGGIHWVLPSRLSAVETVYALTVHKSQGSEFEHCALLLPPELNPVLTRELVYTGLTRGKRRVSVVTTGNPLIVEAACRRTVQRAGGLFGDLTD